MTSGNTMFERKAIEAEARDWVIRMDGGPLSADDRAALAEWMNRSPVHSLTLRQLAQLWAHLDDLGEIVREQREAAAAVRPVAAAESAPVFRARATRAAPAARRFPAMAAMAAGILLCAAAGLFYVEMRGAAPQVDIYATEIGEQRMVALPDGSQAQLNTGTELEIEFAGGARQVRLLRGEAVFDVAHDPASPFIVFADGSAVRAVGTQFSVRTDGGVDVIVTEGVVELFAAAASPRDAAQGGARLVANQAAQRSASGFTVRDMDAREIERRLAWREGALVFEGQRLSEVLAEWTRYTAVQFEIADPELRDLGIGGRFAIGDTDDLLSTLQTVFGVEVTREGETRVRLSSAGQG